MPYLKELSVEAHEKGLPVMRPMHMVFPDDPAAAYLDRQYMLGDRLLVAPVFSPDGRQSWYLPEGRWVHLLDGTALDGGRWYEETWDYFDLPLYVREGDPLLAAAAGLREEAGLRETAGARGGEEAGCV